MAKKLWEKNTEVDSDVDRYTVGLDREMDLYIAEWDIIGSLAHIRMLEKIGLLAADELSILTKNLREIYNEVLKPGFEIGRSRNDQVLVDLKLMMRAKIEKVADAVSRLFDILINQSDRYADVTIPGYTHLQVAMPSSVGMWLGAYAEGLTDDITVLSAAYNVVNRNPLGSAAGYGSSFPLDRDLTTRLMGFESVAINSVYAQMGRGKTERIVAQALGNIAATVGKLAMDACLYNSQNFGFIKLPDEFTTGSSIMPHKKNPDVFELTRAKCNKIQALPYEITLITSNLPSGYFRDLQLIKENFLPTFDTLIDILDMTGRMIGGMTVNRHTAEDPRYDLMYSVEEVNRLVKEGVPFRDAYKQVGLAIERGEFKPDKVLQHSHIGSTGNLGNDRLRERMKSQLALMDFATWHKAVDSLLGK